MRLRAFLKEMAQSAEKYDLNGSELALVLAFVNQGLGTQMVHFKLKKP